MVELLAALACLAFSGLMLLGGLVDAVYERVFARTVEVQYGTYQRNPWMLWPFRVPSPRTHVRITRGFMTVGGLLFSVVCIAWVVAIAIR